MIPQSIDDQHGHFDRNIALNVEASLWTITRSSEWDWFRGNNDCPAPSKTILERVMAKPY